MAGELLEPVVTRLSPVLDTVTAPPVALVPGLRLMAPRLALPVTEPTTPPPPPTLCTMISELPLPLLRSAAVLLSVIEPPAWDPPLLVEPS